MSPEKRKTLNKKRLSRFNKKAAYLHGSASPLFMIAGPCRLFYVCRLREVGDNVE